VTESAVEEVLNGEASDGTFVGFDERHPKVRQEPSQIDGGATEVGHSLRERLRLDPGDNPVAAPPSEPIWRRVSQVAFLKIHGPGTMNANVLGDAVEQAPTVAAG
jgi:hypothetical protein